MSLQDPGAGTADAVYATDESGTLIAWNAACEKLLGHPAPGVLGRRCHEIVQGRDLLGNLHCCDSCSIRAMAHRKEPVRSFPLRVRHASGETLPVTVSVLRLDDTLTNRYTLVHLAQPMRSEHDLPREHRLPAPALSDLTPRETEILELMACGLPGHLIAHRLNISYATVRSHTQNILRKLGVHSRLEAIALLFHERE